MTFVRSLFKSRLPLFFLIPYAAVMIFSGLGDSALQMDEGQDTFVSTTILKYGVPMHSDGLNRTMGFADIYDGIFIYRTWFPYYFQAFSIWALGQTTFAARLPFAIYGLLSVCAIYFLALKLSRNKIIAVLASLFLASSIPALVLFRAARYFSLPILFTILMLYFYIDLFESGKKWRPWVFIAVSICYFHSMYVEFVSTSLGIVCHLILNRKLADGENIKRLFYGFAGIALINLPWLIVILPVFSNIIHAQEISNNAIDTSVTGHGKHLLSFLFQLNNYIFPFILLPLLLAKTLKPYGKEVQLLLCCALSVILVATLHPIPSQFYITACFPPLFILLAMMIVEGVPYGPKTKAPLALALVATNILHVGPLLPLKPLIEKNAVWFEKSIYLEGAYGTFMREAAISSIFHKYLYEITHPYSGPLDAVLEFFKARGKAGETCYISSEGDAFAYYTGMKLVRKNEISSKSRPDWIVLRSGNISIEGNEPPRSSFEARLREIIRSGPYKKFVLSSPVDRVNNAYEIQIHKFQTLPMGEITIYRLEKDETPHSPR
ncbi:glycosyltransferase family 39 protein [Candidatus Uhrbacteria bacterium]|nr:glycosyltransferase family 39 protein [Candidatus Uhrbacteria bacterium]